MKNLLLLFLIGTTCTISAQKLNKVLPLRPLNGGLITPDEKAVLDYEKNINSDYSSSKEARIEDWVNVSGLQAEVGNPDLKTPNVSIIVYPDSTVKQLSSAINGATLSASRLSGSGISKL